MKSWPYKVGSYSIEAIRVAVADQGWQQFRKTLKGLPTEEKLDRLERHLIAYDGLSPRTRIRVDNYINALKRGGQLNLNLEVRR